MNPELRLCPSCWKKKPLDDFGWRDRKHTSRASWCFECFAKYKKEYYRLNKPRIQRQLKRTNKRLRERNKRRFALRQRRKSGTPLSPAEEREERALLGTNRRQRRRRLWNRQCKEWRHNNAERQDEYMRRSDERKARGLIAKERALAGEQAVRLFHRPSTLSQPGAVLLWRLGKREPLFSAPTEDEARAYAEAHNLIIVP